MREITAPEEKAWKDKRSTSKARIMITADGILSPGWFLRGIKLFEILIPNSSARVLLRAEPTSLCSLHELSFKNSLQMRCCIICWAYSASVLSSKHERKRNGVSLHYFADIHGPQCILQAGRSLWHYGSYLMYWSSKDTRKKGIEGRSSEARILFLTFMLLWF